MIDKEGIQYIEKNLGGIQLLFDYLQDSMGGHGNGLCMVYNDKKIKIIKGVKLSNEVIANEILTSLNNIKYIIYHTRLASVGTITDYNCHPFAIDKKVIAMNGTERGIKSFAEEGKTDTETILQLCHIFKRNVYTTVQNFNSVFLGYENGKVFMSKGYGDLLMLKASNTSIIFASEFPEKYYKHKQVFEAPYEWIEGKDISFKGKKPVVFTPKKIMSYSSLYTGCEDDYSQYYEPKKITAETSMFNNSTTKKANNSTPITALTEYVETKKLPASMFKDIKNNIS
jgi:hypothetical protein